MTDVPPTPSATLTRARGIALAEGLRYVYTGTVPDLDGSTTFCPNPHSHASLVERDWYRIAVDCLSGTADGSGAAHCPECGTPVRSEEHTSELQSHSEISYAVFCLKKKK